MGVMRSSHGAKQWPKSSRSIWPVCWPCAVRWMRMHFFVNFKTGHDCGSAVLGSLRRERQPITSQTLNTLVRRRGEPGLLLPTLLIKAASVPLMNRATPLIKFQAAICTRVAAPKRLAHVLRHAHRWGRHTAFRTTNPVEINTQPAAFPDCGTDQKHNADDHGC